MSLTAASAKGEMTPSPRRPAVIARERSDEAIQTVALLALVWIASLPLAMTIGALS